jgi:hypothetical protein
MFKIMHVSYKLDLLTFSYIFSILIPKLIVARSRFAAIKGGETRVAVVKAIVVKYATIVLQRRD